METPKRLLFTNKQKPELSRDDEINDDDVQLGVAQNYFLIIMKTRTTNFQIQIKNNRSVIQKNFKNVLRVLRKNVFKKKFKYVFP